MPEYDFRCEKCAHRFSVNYKTYAMYDSAIARCPRCESTDLRRLISQVAILKSNRDYRSMSSQEMHSVLESGETGQVDEMFNQVTGGQGADQGAATSEQSADGSDTT